MTDLATLIEAGIPPLAACKKLVPASNASRTAALQLLEKGSTLSHALYTTKLISRYEKEIVDVAEQAGRLNEGLRKIADANEQRHLRNSQLKSRLYFPLAIIAVAIVVNFILSIANHASVFSALGSSLISLIVTIGVTQIILNLTKKDACEVLDSLSLFQQQPWYKQLIEHVVFHLLLWQIKSGIDFKQSFIGISRLLNNKTIKKELVAVGMLCDKGQSVCLSLSNSKLPLSADFKNILRTAEASGSWSFAIEK